MKRAFAIAFCCTAGAFPALSQDEKIERGVAAPAAKKGEAAAPPAPAGKADKTYPPVSLGIAGISTILIIGAVCVPIRGGEEDEE